MGCGGSVELGEKLGPAPGNKIQCANDDLQPGDRCQTQRDDNLWYIGTCTAVFMEVHSGHGFAAMKYDDSSEWTGRSNKFFKLEPEHPGFAQSITTGCEEESGIVEGMKL